MQVLTGMHSTDDDIALQVCFGQKCLYAQSWDAQVPGTCKSYRAKLYGGTTRYFSTLADIVQTRRYLYTRGWTLQFEFQCLPFISPVVSEACCQFR